MARPGIMLYFDIREPLRVLPDADKGRLFDAILEYGEHGTIPEFDGMMALAWGFIKPKLDRDAVEYANTVSKRQYAAFCRELKKKGAVEITFEEWSALSDGERKQMLSCDINRYPTTTATLTPTTTSTSKSTTTSTAAVAVTTTGTATEPHDTAAAAAEYALQSIKGELGKGVVFLTEAQISSLLEQLDLDAFDYYVDKLASFIIRNDAKVKNHYETILRWWREDSGR